jgi:mRNA-degrading endonuclease toxin of MazEF toxin-antitoxin module
MEVVQGGIYMYEPPQQSASVQSALLTTSGSEQSGWRPWVIISRDLLNRVNTRTAVGVPLSTNVGKANSYRILLPAAELIADAGSTYVFQNSVALCDHVRVLDLNQIRRKVGRVSANGLISIVGVGLAFVTDIPFMTDPPRNQLIN